MKYFIYHINNSMFEKNETIIYSNKPKIMRIIIDIEDVPGIDVSSVTLDINEEMFQQAILESTGIYINLLQEYITEQIAMKYVKITENEIDTQQSSQAAVTRFHIRRIVNQFIQYSILKGVI